MAITTGMVPSRTSGATSTTLPDEGYRLPTFTLPGAAGAPVRLWDYKQRRPVLLAFLHAITGAQACATCQAWLRAAYAERAQFVELNAVVLVVTPEPSEHLAALQTELGAPYVLLSDTEGAVAAQYVPPTSAGVRAGVALYATDRYLHCLTRWYAADAAEFPALDTPLAELTYAQQEGCGCALPAWPAR